MKIASKKFVVVLLILTLFTATLPAPAHADIWGESIYGAMFLKQTLEEMYNKIQQTLVANLRMMAMRLIQTRLMSIFGGAGGAGGPKVIGDWRQFIYGAATTYSMKATNDFFRGMQSGIPSPLASRIITPAQRAVNNVTNIDAYQNIKPDLQNYVREGRADMIFRQGWAQNPQAAWIMADAPQNNMASMYLMGKQLKDTKAAQEAEVKKAEGVAGAGYEGTKKTTSSGGTNGGSSEQITMPGSSAKDMVTKVQSMPIDAISMARTIPDVVASMVTSMLTQMLNKGFNMATMKINQAANSVAIPNIQSQIQKGIK